MRLALSSDTASLAAQASNASDYAAILALRDSYRASCERVGPLPRTIKRGRL